MAKSKIPQNVALKVGVLADKDGKVTGIVRADSSGGAGMTGFGSGKPEDTPAVKAAKANADTKSTKRYAEFGENDGLVKLILDKLEKSHLAYDAIEKNANALQGQKIVYYNLDDLAKGIVQQAYDPEIESVIREDAHRFEHIGGKAWDLATFWNAACQHIFNMKRTKIVRLKHLEFEFSKISKFHPTQGTFDRTQLFYSSNFTRTVKASDFDDPTQVTTFDLYDPDDPYFFQNLIKKKAATFATHTRPRTSRSFFYALPKHAGLYVENGWIDNTIEVPQMVMAMAKNQVSLRYIFYFTEMYFFLRFGENQWIEMSPEDRQKKFDEVGAEMETKLVGTKNAYSSLRLMMGKNMNTGEYEKLVYIEAVDDKAKVGTWVPTTDEGNKQIVMGHGWNPSAYGLSNSNVRMNSTSGSANRESFNTVVSLNTPAQMLLLSDYQLMANFNAANGHKNWRVLFAIEDIAHTTTNEQENGLVPSNPVD